MKKQDRRQQFMDAALHLARTLGVAGLTHANIAERCGVARTLVVEHWGTITNIRRDVMRAAVKQEIVPIVARGLAVGDTQARKAGPELRAKVATYVGGQ